MRHLQGSLHSFDSFRPFGLFFLSLYTVPYSSGSYCFTGKEGERLPNLRIWVAEFPIPQKKQDDIIQLHQVMSPQKIVCFKNNCGNTACFSVVKVAERLEVTKKTYGSFLDRTNISQRPDWNEPFVMDPNESYISERFHSEMWSDSLVHPVSFVGCIGSSDCGACVQCYIDRRMRSVALVFKPQLVLFLCILLICFCRSTCPCTGTHPSLGTCQRWSGKSHVTGFLCFFCRVGCFMVDEVRQWFLLVNVDFGIFGTL